MLFAVRVEIEEVVEGEVEDSEMLEDLFDLIELVELEALLFLSHLQGSAENDGNGGVERGLYLGVFTFVFFLPN